MNDQLRVEAAPHKMVWLNWLSRWLVWVLGTTLGWALALAMGISTIMASIIWDTDEVAAYLRLSLWERLSAALWRGMIVGLVLGAIVGLVQRFALRRRARDAALSALAIVVGSMALCAVSGTSGPAQYESSFLIALRAIVIGGVLGGGFSGVCQWIVLRRILSKANGWILLTMAGWATGLPMALWAGNRAAQPLLHSPFSILHSSIVSSIALIALGALIGVGQWLILRHSVQRAGWWIVATAGGWGLALLVGRGFGSAALFGAGALIGAATGTALVLLVRLAPRPSGEVPPAGEQAAHP